MTNLPIDVLDRILSYSTFRSIHMLSLTGKALKSFSENNTAWEILLRHFSLKVNPRARLCRTAFAVVKRDVCFVCFAARKDKNARFCNGCRKLWQSYLDEKAYCDTVRAHLAQSLESGDEDEVDTCLWKLHVRESALNTTGCNAVSEQRFDLTSIQQ